MNALEQSFADLCAKHDLSALSVGISIGHRERFTVYAHWNPRGCASGSADNIARAVGIAIAEAAAERGTADPITLADEPLTEMAA